MVLSEQDDSLPSISRFRMQPVPQQQPSADSVTGWLNAAEAGAHVHEAGRDIDRIDSGQSRSSQVTIGSHVDPSGSSFGAMRQRSRDLPPSRLGSSGSDRGGPPQLPPDPALQPRSMSMNADLNIARRSLRPPPPLRAIKEELDSPASSRNQSLRRRLSPVDKPMDAAAASGFPSGGDTRGSSQGEISFGGLSPLVHELPQPHPSPGPSDEGWPGQLSSSADPARYEAAGQWTERQQQGSWAAASGGPAVARSYAAQQRENRRWQQQQQQQLQPYRARSASPPSSASPSPAARFHAQRQAEARGGDQRQAYGEGDQRHPYGPSYRSSSACLPREMSMAQRRHVERQALDAAGMFDRNRRASPDRRSRSWSPAPREMSVAHRRHVEKRALAAAGLAYGRDPSPRSFSPQRQRMPRAMSVAQQRHMEKRAASGQGEPMRQSRSRSPPMLRSMSLAAQRHAERRQAPAGSPARHRGGAQLPRAKSWAAQRRADSAAAARQQWQAQPGQLSLERHRPPAIEVPAAAAASRAVPEPPRRRSPRQSFLGGAAQSLAVPALHSPDAEGSAPPSDGPPISLAHQLPPPNAGQWAAIPKSGDEAGARQPDNGTPLQASPVAEQPIDAAGASVALPERYIFQKALLPTPSSESYPLHRP